MFNEKYIRDFSEKSYLDYLNDRNALKEISDSYINQYSSPTYDCTIAFKESLDHYILKQIKTNPFFLKTHYFKNYLDYINYTFSNRISSANMQLEYNTNIIFNNPEAKKILLSFYNENTQSKLKEIIDMNNKRINAIYNKMCNKEKVTQDELNLIGDYLYTKKEFSSEIYHKYIEFLLNDMSNNLEVKNSPQIIAAYIAYLPKIFGDGCENSRILLTNGYASQNSSILPNVLNNVIRQEQGKSNNDKTIKNLGLYSSGDKYISVAKNQLDFSLISDKSLNNSRTMTNKDIYWISMVCFHELTHQYQVRHMKDEKFNSSGLSMIMRNLIFNGNDYNNNHDSYEMEIEADENSWKKMYDFIFNFRLKRAINNDRKIVEEQLKKCTKNKKAVYSRRTFLTKKDEKDDTNYFETDMNFILNNFKQDHNYSKYFKKLWPIYPMMQKLFTESGQMKTTILFDENITSSNYSGLDNNIMSSEISNYILTKGYNSLKEHIIKDDLSEKKIENLFMNIYNTYHLNKMYVQELSKVDLEQYNETHHNYDLSTIRTKYLEKFKEVSSLIYKERELVSIIGKKYPQYDIEKYANPKYANWNYNDMFEYLYNASNGVIDPSEIEDVITVFENSKDTVLTNLANKTKEMLKLTINLDSGFSK